MTVLSDITIEELCTDKTLALKNRITFLREQLELTTSQPNVQQHFRDELERVEYRLSRIDPNWKPMIYPFSNQANRVDENDEKIISWGLSGYGYDVRLAPSFKIFTNINSSIIDPKDLDRRCFVDFEGDVCIIPPNSYVLGHTIEYFSIPKDILTIVVGKSTYARSGIIVNVTPIEPGFEGEVVVELSNSTSLPVKVYANEGVAQFLFLKGDQPCRVSYADKQGKYQHQRGITLPRV